MKESEMEIVLDRFQIIKSYRIEYIIQVLHKLEAWHEQLENIWYYRRLSLGLRSDLDKTSWLIVDLPSRPRTIYLGIR